MKKQLRFLMLTLLCAVFSTVWGADEVFYTLTPAIGSNNGYASNCDITIEGITWNVTGNSTLTPWRIGGKSLSNVDRAVYSKTAMGSAISKVELEVGAASDITVNSTKLIVASDASFNNILDEVTKTFSANSTLTFTPTSGTEWATDAYYKFVFNVTVSGTKNKFIEFKGATFYKLSGDISAPTFDVPSGNVSEGTTVTITADEGLWISYTTDGTDPTKTTLEQWVQNNVADVIINNTCTLKAIAIDPVKLDKSEVVEATYTVAGSEQVVFEIVTDASSLKAGDEIVLVSHKDYKLYAMGEQRTNNRAGVALADEFKGGAYPTQLASNNDVAIITLEGSSTAWNFKVDGGYLYAASSSSNHLKTENAVDAAGNANATITISGVEHDAAIKFNGDHTRNNLKFNNSDELFSCYASGQQTVKIYRKTTTTPQPDAPVIWMTYSSDNDLDFTGKTDYTAYIATNYRAEEGVVVLTKIEKVPSGEGILIKSNDSSKAIKDIFKESDVPANEPITTQITQMLVGAPAGVEYLLPEEGDYTNFVLAKREGVVGFYKVAQQGALASNKAYLQIPTASLTVTSGANGITFVEDGTTAIQGVTTATTADDAWYTLQGVRVAQPTRGLYIHNGKKIVVK